MYSKFPFSMEDIPRPRSFACLSLKFGSVISALIVILQSVLSLAQCTSAIVDLWPAASQDPAFVATFGAVVMATVTYCVTLSLTALMLVGALREKSNLIRPWVVWTSILVLIQVLLFVFWTTVLMTSRSGRDSLFVYVIEFLGLLIRFYMLMLVSSFCKQLEEEHRDGERVKYLLNKEFKYQAV